MAFLLLLSVPVLGQTPEKERPALQHFHKGFRYLQENKLDDAIAEYRKAIELEPTLGVAHAELALVLALKNDWDAAEASLEKAFAVEPNNPGIFVVAGSIHGLKGERDKAIEDYERAVALNPKQLDAHDNLGRAYLNKENAAKALVHFGEILQHMPDSPAGQLGVCLAFTLAGDLDHAKTSCMRAREVDPQVAVRLRQEAYRLTQKDQLKPALLRAQAAVFAAPNDAGTWVLYGALLHEAKRKTEAVEKYKQALSIDPDYAPARNNLGHLLRNQGRTDEAIAELKEAVRLKPDYALAYHNLGEAYLDKRNFPSALESFQQAIRIQPNYQEVKNDLAKTHTRWGLSLLRENRLVEALEHFNGSLKWDELANAYSGLCWIRLREGSVSDGRALAEKAISLNSSYPWGYSCLAATAYEAENFQAAVDYWQKAVTLEPNEGHFRLGLALGLLAQGKEEEALKAYRDAVLLHPYFADASSLGKDGLLWSPALRPRILRLLELDKAGPP